jgi:hypothetical protein
MIPADNQTFRLRFGVERTSGYSPHRQGGAHASARRRFQVTPTQANLKTLGWMSCAMGKLVFGLNQSLDGYVDH